MSSHHLLLMIIAVIFFDGIITSATAMVTETLTTHYLESDLTTCIQNGRCGAKAICTFDIINYEPPCLTEQCVLLRANKTATPQQHSQGTTTDGKYVKKSSLYGQIILLKNGLNRPLELVWDLVGIPLPVKNDNAGTYEPQTIDNEQTRKYLLPPLSSAYVDTGIYGQHTIGIMTPLSGGGKNGNEKTYETIATLVSSHLQCTKRETCLRMDSVCSSSFLYLNTAYLSPKMRCMMYTSACNGFVERLDQIDDDDMDDDDEDNNHNSQIEEEEEEGEHQTSYALANLETRLNVIKEESNRCLVDCLWNFYPRSYLPKEKNMVYNGIDSRDMLRRLYVGVSTNPNQCTDVAFDIDDKMTFMYHTADDEDISDEEKESLFLHDPDKNGFYSDMSNNNNNNNGEHTSSNGGGFYYYQHKKSSNKSTVIALSIVIAMLSVFLLCFGFWFVNFAKRANRTHGVSSSYSPMMPGEITTF